MNKWAIAFYFFFLILFTGFSYLFVDPGFIHLHRFYTGFATSHRTLVTNFYIFLVVVFFLFYMTFLREIEKKRLTKNNILILIAGSVFILIFSYPAILSFDIFNYIATAKVTFFYHENPYIVMPIEFLGDSMLLFTHAANKIALYGPVWTSVSVIPYFLGAGIYLLTIITFKVFVIFFYLGTVLILWKLSKNLLAVSFFSLNPLVLIETVVSGHNDIAMMFFVLLSFFLFKKRHYLLVGLFFLLSILIKYATLFLLPIFLYLAWRRYRRREINWENVFLTCSFIMFIVFLSSFLREEIYPWYAIWFLSFASFIHKRKLLFYTFLSFSFSLLLGYIPFMFLGTYFGPTPIIKTIVVFTMPLFVLVFLLLLRKRNV